MRKKLIATPLAVQIGQQYVSHSPLSSIGLVLYPVTQDYAQGLIILEKLGMLWKKNYLNLICDTKSYCRNLSVVFKKQRNSLIICRRMKWRPLKP